MKGNLKKISLLGVILALMVVCVPNVKAARTCTEYTNYYFFLQKQRTMDDNIFENGDTYYATNSAYYPTLPTGATIKTAERVCMKKGSLKDGICNETWELSDYYNRLKGLEGLQDQTFNISANETRTYRKKEINSSTTYYSKITETWSNYTTDSLVAATYFPDEVTITKTSDNYKIAMTVNRTIKRSNFNSTTPVSHYWDRTVSDDGTVNEAGNYDTWVSPTIYKIKYEVCTGTDDPAPTYTVKVNYYYYKDGKTTTEKYAEPFTKTGIAAGGSANVTYATPRTGCKIVTSTGEDSTATGETITNIRENITKNIYYSCEVTPDPTYTVTVNYLSKEDKKPVADPYTKEEVNANYTEKKDSPKIKNCTPDQETVNISVKDSSGKAANRVYNVYYTCKIDKETGDVKTGDALIYIAWIVGFGALGYATYYLIKLRKARKEEV